MKCYKCPYIQEQFDYRIQKLNGDPICGEIEYDEAEYDHVDYCYCEKMGGKICIVGRCPEAEVMTKEEWDEYRSEHGMSPIDDDQSIEEVIAEVEIDPVPIPTKKQKKRNRNKKYQNKLKNMFIRGHWFNPAYPVNKEGSYDPENPVRYKRDYSPRRAKFLRKLSNKKVRKTKGVSNRGNYRKIFDYFWEMW